MTFSPYAANRVLSGNPIVHSTMYVKVHKGPTGPGGLLNPSTATVTRVLGNFTVVTNRASNTSDVTLPSDGTGSETITHISLWDALAGGNCLHTEGVIVPYTTYNAGDEVVFSAGDLAVMLEV